MLVSTASYLYTTRAGKFAVWERLLREAGIGGRQRLLDMGCGRGAVLLMAAGLLPDGRAVGIDLWKYKAPDGGTLAKAVDLLIAPAKGGPWSPPDLDVFDGSFLLDKLHVAAAHGDSKAAAAVAKVPAPSGGDLWPLVPTCWEDLSGPPKQK